MAHLYATFADAALAEKAAGALLDFGVRKEDLTLVANETHGKTRDTSGVNQTNFNDTVRSDANTTGERIANDTYSAGNRLAQAGDRVAGAVTGAVGAQGASSGFEAAGDRRDIQADGRAEMAGANASGFSSEGRSHTDAMDEEDDTVNGVASNDDRTDLAAKHGLSTTTPADAGAGAVKGTEIGLGVGILAGLASLLVPGVGLVLGGGALATALGGAALTAGAGAVAGGVTGYLKEQGVPGDAIEHYQGAVEHGGAILSINLPSGEVDQTAAEQVLSKYGASNVNAY